MEQRHLVWNRDKIELGTDSEWVIGILPEAQYVFDTSQEVKPLRVIIGSHLRHYLPPPTFTPHCLL